MQTPKVTKVYQNHHLDSKRWDRYAPRNDDIIVTTSYKCGTTFTQQILLHLRCCAARNQGKHMSELIEQLKLHEAVRSKVYLCSENYETIGVGRNISESGIGLSYDEIAYLLGNDIQRCEQELSERFGWFDDLDDVRRDALIDMAFNLGITRLSQFKNMLGALSESRFSEAASQALDSR